MPVRAIYMIAHYYFMGASQPVPPRPRVIIYIDGFNLYYGAVRSTPRLKWLNLEHFCRLLRPHDDIQQINYFTAMVSGPRLPHQETYLKALSTTPIVNVVLGKFKMKRVLCRVTACTHAGQRFFQAQEEKRTDVSIAIAIVDDAHENRCDHQIVISGDSDLVPAINMARIVQPTLKTTVYVPSTNPLRGAAVELRAAAHANRTLPVNLLAKAQFPDTFPDGAGGVIVRPAAWV